MLRSRKMAVEASSNHDRSNLGIKVKGDIGDFQIIEDKSDSDEEDVTEHNNARTVSRLSRIPAGLVHPSTPAKISSVVVKDSENVQFGNNTHFHGPVTIKQVIQNNREYDNSAYIKTESEDVTPGVCKQEDPSNNIPEPRKFQFQTWHKITLSALSLAIIAAICAVASIILTNSTQDDKTTTHFKDDLPKCILVADSYHATHKIVTITISISIVVSLTYFIMHNKPFNGISGYKDTADPLVIAPDHLRIVPRSDWLAQPVEDALDIIRQPVPWVIIAHTATEECSIQSECVLRVRLIQTYHIESKKWYDIGYNFLVGGDGSAYHGRGWDSVGAHTYGYNVYSIGIAFIGTFNNKRPPKKQLEACQKLINRGVKMGKLAKDYKLFAHRQLASTLSPGDELYNIIKTWPHFAQNFTDIKELMPNY